MEYVSGNIFIREMGFLKAGDVVDGHAHDFDHTTYVTRGSIQIERLDALGRIEKTVVKKASQGYNWILIKAGVCHRLTALEDNSMGHCVYAHRNPQGEVVQEDTGWGHG